MELYSVKFIVDTDNDKRDRVFHHIGMAEDFDDVVSQTYTTYKQALRYVWKTMESSICMEPRPNSMFSIEFAFNGLYIKEEDALQLFFQIRKQLWLDTVHHYERNMVAL